MRKIFAFTLLTLFGKAEITSAQTPFATNDSITINNLNTGVTVHGDMFCDPGTGGYIHRHSEFPAGSHKHINLIGALWLSANDDAGQLHTAAQTFRQSGNDFWPGPLDATDSLSYANSYKWAKIWKLNRTDIQAFQAMTSHTTGNTLPAILTWPGKGNVHAVGNGGYTLSITNDMAPFVDLNSNGIYEPLSGEYPDIKGDQALWWVFSDNGPAHTETNGRPLKVEVHAMVYGYKRNTLIDNVLYYDYTIINRSANNYGNFRTAVWDDPDLGYYLDDFIGFDSSHRMAITYNSVAIDGQFAGVPDDAYGANPPVTGLSMVVLPGDDPSSYMPAGSFNIYDNDGSVRGNPTVATDYDNYMRAKIRNGAPITNNFGGAGMPCGTMGTGTPCNYYYPGDPSDPTQWSECKCANNAGDRRFILSSNSFALSAGATAHVSIALMAIANGGTCGTADFSGIKNLADTAWSIHQHPLTPLPVGVATVAANNKLTLYPNPAGDMLYIDDDAKNAHEPATATVYNTLGQKVNIITNQQNGKYALNISNLLPGVYHILFAKGTQQSTATFVKK